MKEIVINVCYGGFGLSLEGQRLLAEYKEVKDLYFYAMSFDGNSKAIYRKVADETSKSMFVTPLNVDLGENPSEQEFHRACNDNYHSVDFERDDSDLVKVVNTLGDKANGKYSQLKVVKIPDDVEWEIEEYDGTEWVAEKHRVWS
jgi:hypothetical protein